MNAKMVRKTALAALFVGSALFACADVPTGVVAVDYVESTGTQYVDPGYTPSNVARVYLRYAFTDTTSGGALYAYGGSGSGTSLRFIRSITGGVEEMRVTRLNKYEDYDVAYQNVTPSTSIRTLDVGPRGIFVDGSKVADARAFNGCAGSGYLFAQKNGWGGQESYAKARIYACVLADSQWVKRIFVPVKDAQGRGALYDVHEGKIYYATGGDLVAGPVSANQDVFSVRRVDWVASSGDSYVDTLVKPGKDTIFNLRFSMLDDTSNECAIFGFNASKRGRSSFGMRQFSEEFGEIVKVSRDDSYATCLLITNAVMPTGVRTCDVAPRRIALDGCTSTTGLVKGDCYGTAYLFDNHAQWLDSVAPVNLANPCKMKIYGCGIWNAGDVGISGQKNLVPARLGPLPILYDLVNSTGYRYYFPTGGWLEAGPDSEDQDLGTETKYKPLAYVESDGSRYIDTQIKASDSTRVVIKFKFTDTVSEGHFFGYGASAAGRSLRLYRSIDDATGEESWEIHHGPTYEQSGVTVLLGAASTRVHTLDISNDAYLLDGVSVGTPVSLGGTCAGPCFLGTMCAAWNSNAPELGVPMRIYGCQVYENGTLVRDYVPSRYRGVVGFYDQSRDKYCGGGFGPGKKSGLILLMW